MYETFFGLKRRPFLAVPDTESYFSIPQMEAAQQSIERTVRRGEGISLIVGPHGIGKTLLLRLLRKSLNIEYTVALIANGRLDSAKAFFQQLLYELRLPFSQADETELRLKLLDFARQETTPGIVLLLDEAQYLDRSVLEEILLLMNCDDGAMPFFRTVLAGTIDFEEKLTHPHLEAFNQRIVSRSYLDTMSRDETLRYIAWQTGISKNGLQDGPSISDGLNEIIQHSGRIQEDLIPAKAELRRMDGPHVGLEESIFSDEARRTVYRLTDGLPRLVNQLCDGAMQIAAERISRRINEDLIQSSWAQLQQIDKEALDTDSESTDPTENRESIEEIIARKRESFQLKEFGSSVEFGTLDDSDESREAEKSEDCIATELETESEAESSEEAVAKTEEIVEQIENIDEKTSITVGVSTTEHEHESVYIPAPNQYKPPYPEDDDDDLIENTKTSIEIEKIELQAVVDQLDDRESNAVEEQEIVLNNENEENEKNNFSVSESPEEIEESESESESEVVPADAAACLVDAVDNVFYEDSVSVTEALEVLPFVEDLNQAIEAVAIGAVAEESPETDIETDIAADIETTAEARTAEKPDDELENASGRTRCHGMTLRYPIRHRNVKWDGPRRYKQRKKISDQTQQNQMQTAERFASLSLAFRVFGIGDPWIGNVATRFLYQPGRWSVDAIANLDWNVQEASAETGLPVENEADKEEILNDKILDDKIDENIEEPENALFSETNDLEKTSEEPDMDPETLKQYGAEVLAGRAPFVRKEPNYVYQTDDHAPPRFSSKNASPYYDPTTGSFILLNWVLPQQSEIGGIGTAYRNFASRESVEPTACHLNAKEKQSQFESPAKPETSRIVRISMDSMTSEQEIGTKNVRRTIDESFDETVSVKRSVVSLEDVYKPETTSAPPVIPAAQKPVEQTPIAQQEIDSVIRRITEAAQKIEQAAETTVHAGQRIRQSADFVEIEVRTALPNYKELFMELADFQKELSKEMKTLKGSARAAEFVALPVEQIPTWLHHSTELPQQPDALPVVSTERGRLLPFPKRPDIVPPNSTANQNTTENGPPSSEIASPDGDDSVDLRSLFQ